MALLCYYSYLCGQSLDKGRLDIHSSVHTALLGLLSNHLCAVHMKKKLTRTYIYIYIYISTVYTLVHLDVNRDTCPPAQLKMIVAIHSHVNCCGRNDV